MKLISRYALLRITIGLFLLCALTLAGISYLTNMPSKSFNSPLPPYTHEEAELSSALQLIVKKLAEEIGERNYLNIDKLNTAADFIEQSFSLTGLSVQRQTYSIAGKVYYNIEAEKKGVRRAGKVVVVGAHYDSVTGSPGANDNGSGIAALLALARAFSVRDMSQTIRFVAFANEEPPFFWTKQMGSYVYAKRCKEREEDIVAMMSLETIGCYFDKKGSQRYLFPLGFFYPSRGNFIAFVSNLSSRKLLKDAVASFRRHSRFPSEGGAFPWFVPGIFWSDHWPFWKMGYSAIMVTDTALFRYPYYHTSLDTPDKINFEMMSRVVAGLEKVIGDLAGDRTKM
jgi:hypothetical protein